MSTQTVLIESPYTSSEVLEALEAVVEGREDYVYRELACQYADEAGNPSCGVGHVVAWLNPQLFERLRGYENERGHSFNITRAAFLVNKDEDGVTHEIFTYYAKFMLQQFQMAQDHRQTWGEALRLAREVPNAGEVTQ